MNDKFPLRCIVILFISILIFASCESSEMKFNKSKWEEQSDGFYEHREKMVNDLTKNHLRKGMTYEELVNMLGTPENYADMEINTIVYTIMEYYGSNIDPIETKTLRIKLTKDSLVEDYKIIHWKN